VEDVEARVKRMNQLFAKHDAFFHMHKGEDTKPAFRAECRTANEQAQAIKAGLEADGVKLVWSAKGYAEVTQ